MPLISLHNVGFFVFQSINIILSKSECIGISGASGSGKTRLLRIIADLEPFSGNITLESRPMNSHQPHEWRRRVGLLPAESQWWFDTVGEHFSNPDNELLLRLGFESDVLNWKIIRLSTGEKQRLALARLLHNQPKVLLLDEPTSNLDRKFVSVVEDILAKYKENGAGLMWVSHDNKQLNRVADRRLFIRDDKLVECP